MKIYDSIEIAAPPEVVWPLLADPEQMVGWHARLVSVQRPVTGVVRLGERYVATYLMSGKQGIAETEVIRCQPPVELVLRQHIKMMSRDGHVDEHFTLAAKDRKTLVKQAVDFKHSLIPWWARALMWVLSRFGRAAEPSLLQPLKHAAEAARDAQK
jgi:hypothetical protein